MSQRSSTHATFVIERDYPHPPAKVFAAFASAEVKGKWFGGPDEWERSAHTLDFRVGGGERLAGGPPGGTVHAFSGTYWDIVENERIVQCYDMHLDDIRISVSLATTEIRPHGAETKLIYTEQGVYLDGFDGAEGREEGTRDLLDNLGRFLGR